MRNADCDLRNPHRVPKQIVNYGPKTIIFYQTMYSAPLYVLLFFIASIFAEKVSETLNTTTNPSTVESTPGSNDQPLPTTSETLLSDEINLINNTGSILTACIVGIMVGVAAFGVFVTCAMRGFWRNGREDETKDDVETHLQSYENTTYGGKLDVESFKTVSSHS